MNDLKYGVLFLGLAIASGCSGVDSHSCTTVYFQSGTTIAVVSPGNTWNAATYSLALTFDGGGGSGTVSCTLGATSNDLSSPNVITGTCSAMNVQWTMQPVCPQPAPTCNTTSCTQTGSSANCLTGQFQMVVSISPTLGGDGGDGLPARVGLELSAGATPVVSSTVMPTQTTTEPNGTGCGFVTRGSATIHVAPDAG
jgi:hypothetical protein